MEIRDISSWQVVVTHVGTLTANKITAGMEIGCVELERAMLLLFLYWNGQPPIWSGVSWMQTGRRRRYTTNQPQEVEFLERSCCCCCSTFSLFQKKVYLLFFPFAHEFSSFSSHALLLLLLLRFRDIPFSIVLLLVKLVYYYFPSLTTVLLCLLLFLFLFVLRHVYVHSLRTFLLDCFCVPDLYT